MNPFTKIWFWLLILSIIGFVATIIMFETLGQTSDNVWTWTVFVISIILFMLAFILYASDYPHTKRCEEKYTNHQLITSPCIQKMCYERREMECTEKKSPCGQPPRRECKEKRKVECRNVEQPNIQPVFIRSQTGLDTQHANIMPQTVLDTQHVNIKPQTDINKPTIQKGLLPLSSLAPPTPIMPM